ncbi:MAG TPA: hypothetical protein VFI31_06765, partial [Pirellulales bacterium]|nr:hypothetical protein [Pirellulales bacterium]
PRPTTCEDGFPPLPELPRAAELLVIDDVDGWFGKPGQCVSAAGLARIIQRLNELARSLHVAIIVLVRAQMSVEGRITSRQLSRLAQSASVVWMVVRDRGQGTGQREDGKSSKCKVQSPKSENGVLADDHCKMQIANCKLQNDASGSNLDSRCRNPKTQDLRPKTSDLNPKSDGPAYSQSDRRWLLPVKNNLAPDVETFGRAFELFDGQIRWHGDDPAPDLAEALLPSTHNSDRRRLRHAAAAWLEEALAGGPLASKDLYRQGAENGFSQGTLKRAATELGIHPHKTGFDGGWEMRWTPPPVVRGRGTTARRAGAGFKILGGEEGVAEKEPGREWETERKAEETSQIAKYKSQKAKVDSSSAAIAAEREVSPDPSCASSETSCASSEKSGDFAMASCASSREREEIDAASCASSGTLVESEKEKVKSKCKTQNDASGSNLDPEIVSPETQDLKATASAVTEDSQSDDSRDIYAVIADVMREECLQKAC